MVGAHERVGTKRITRLGAEDAFAVAREPTAAPGRAAATQAFRRGREVGSGKNNYRRVGGAAAARLRVVVIMTSWRQHP